jgi:hypothetical protein
MTSQNTFKMKKVAIGIIYIVAVLISCTAAASTTLEGVFPITASVFLAHFLNCSNLHNDYHPYFLIFGDLLSLSVMNGSEMAFKGSRGLLSPIAWYLDPTGSDINGDGTFERPFFSINRVRSHAVRAAFSQ